MLVGMISSRTTAPTAKSIRLIHAALITGVLLFALVAHFVLRPTLAASPQFSPALVRALLGVAVTLCAVSLLLRQRVPRKSTDESADLFWTRANTPAMVTWATIEGASLLAVFLYGQTSEPGAVGVAAIAVLIFVWINPGYFERR